MGNSKKLAELRNLLQAVSLELESKGPTSSPKIIAAFRAKHSDPIRRLSTELENIALTKFISDVSRRTRSLTVPLQDDLFKDFSGIPQSIAIPGTTDNKRALQRKILTKATIGDVKLWLSVDSARPLRKRQRYSGVAALIKNIEPFASSDETTIDVAYKAWQESKKGG